MYVNQKVLIIIPAYNEEQSVGKVVEEVRAYPKERLISAIRDF
jgi:glycosyltransferase involved in cell wall biosynthesis